MSLTRREAMPDVAARWLSCGVAGAADAGLSQPNHQMIVPYPAGWQTTFSAGGSADQLKAGLGATVIVENKPGAGTTLGAEQVRGPSRMAIRCWMRLDTLPIKQTL